MDEHLDPGRETSISERGLKLLAKLKVDNCFDNLGAFMEAPRSRYRCGMALFRANLRPGQAVSVWSGTSIIGRSCAVCSAWYTLVVSSMRRWGFSIRLRGASTRPQSSTADLDKDRNKVWGGYYGVSIMTWRGILRRRGVTPRSRALLRVRRGLGWVAIASNGSSITGHPLYKGSEYGHGKPVQRSGCSVQGGWGPR